MQCAEWDGKYGGHIRIVKETAAVSFQIMCGILQKQRMYNKNVCYKSYIDEFTTVLLHTEDDEKFKLFLWNGALRVVGSVRSKTLRS
jgi:hypothetical protein